MKAQEFCYWLQGMFELSDVKMLNAVQLETVRKHLQLVFLHDIDPSYPVEQQQALTAMHTPAKEYQQPVIKEYPTEQPSALSQHSSGNNELIRC